MREAVNGFGSLVRAPDHVPTELIRNYEFYYANGTSDDVFKFLRDTHKEEIFFNLNADPIICPNGSWYVSSYDLLTEVLQNPELFSSRDMVQYGRMVGENWDLIPLELDPPDHSRIRLEVMPMFSPARVKVLTERIEQRVVDLIGTFKNDGGCEFVSQFATPFPVSIFLELVDLPFERYRDFVAWARDGVHSGDADVRIRATLEIRDYLQSVVKDRKANPGNDVISQLLAAKEGKEPLNDDEATGLCFMVFLGGLDTVAATLGFTFRYLASHPEARQQLRDDPSIVPSAVEEFLRAFSVVLAKRKITRDIDFHGAPMKKGDYVTCVMGLADTDPKQFGNNEIIMQRADNRHVGFGMGPHRCLGSHLARLELKIALDVFLREIPDFEIKPGSHIATHGAGGLYGIDELPLVWDKA